MGRENELFKLVEQAASAGAMLTAADTSEAGQLLELIGQIIDLAQALGTGPEQLTCQITDCARKTAVDLETILVAEAADCEKAVETVCDQICRIQSLIGELEKGEQAAEPAKTQPTEASAGQAAAKADSAGQIVLSSDDIPLILDFITESGEHIEGAEAALLELENDPRNAETLNTIFRSFHTIKGMAGFLNLEQIGSLAHVAENLLDKARKGNILLAGDNTDAILEAIDMLKQLLVELSAAAESGQPIQAVAGVDELMIVLKQQAGDTAAEPKKKPQDNRSDQQMENLLNSGERRSSFDRRSGEDRRSPGVDEKIKVSTAKLDNLINMAGELVIAHSMVADVISKTAGREQDFDRKISHQSKIVRDLQELSMSLRMVPIAGVFQKMARLTRDLSRKAQKQVQLITHGEDTELDRNIVDKIADPLVHMVRNSVDHGIEEPQQRLAAGKEETGTIELQAFHLAGNIVIEISDDGKGLDRDRILQKALDNGIVDASQQLTDEEVYKLVFHPGLSTAQKVTDISGRGVGMDVVKKNIEQLRGKIEISSEKGKGTTFTVRLPLTLAIIEGQVVRVGTGRYIIPLTSIVKSLRPSAEQISSVQGRAEMVSDRGELIPAVKLCELFGVETGCRQLTEGLLVIVEEDGHKCCLLVDELAEQQQVVIKNLGAALARVKGVSGGAIMGDGKVSLILDIPGLVQLSRQ